VQHSGRTTQRQSEDVTTHSGVCRDIQLDRSSPFVSMLCLSSSL
jgi:hypothetical protein